MCSVGAHVIVVLCIVVLIMAQVYRDRRQAAREGGDGAISTIDLDVESTFFVIPVVFARSVLDFQRMMRTTHVTLGFCSFSFWYGHSPILIILI